MNNRTTLKYLEFLTVACTVAAVVIVPLAMPVFQPHLTYGYGEYKTFALHLLTLLVGASLLIEMLVLSKNNGGFYRRTVINFREIKRNHVNIVVVGMVALLVAHSFSTLFSPLPRQSFFGVSEEFSGFNLYDSISLFTLFIAVTLKFRTRARLDLLVSALVLSGSLTAAYGLGQHFGWDGLGDRQSSVRIPSSFGNTLNFAAFLVLTIPITLSLVVSRRMTGMKVFTGIAFLLGLQLAALWLAGGRGPYIGAAFGVSMLLTMIAVGMGRQGFTKAVSVFVGAFIVALTVIIMPNPTNIDGIERISSLGSELSSLVDDRDDKVDLGVGGLKARSEIWRTVIDLTLNPRVPQEEPRIKTLLRSVYGLGPDMLLFSYPIAVSPTPNIKLQANAHNLPLHILVSVGILGLFCLAIVSIGLGLLTKSMFSALRKNTLNDSFGLMLTTGFLAASVGKAVEMQTGIPRVSDLTPTLVVLGATLAGYIFMTAKGVENDPEKISPQDKASTSMAERTATVGITVIGILFVASIFVGWDVRRLSSTTVLFGLANTTSPSAAGKAYLESHKRAPERRDAISRLSNAYIAESAAYYASGQTDNAQNTILLARELWLVEELRNPYEFNTQITLAKISSIMVERGELEYSTDLLKRYSKIVQYYPGYPSLTGTAATAALKVGEYELAIEYANVAIETEDSTRNWSKAWFARGISKFSLGFEEQGISDLITATEKEPGSQGAELAHSALAKIYRERGDSDLADFHDAKGL